MNRKSKVVTWMDTIWNSVSFPYKWKLISCFGVRAVILEQVVDLIESIIQLSLQGRGILFGYEVAHKSNLDERVQGDSGLVLNFLPKRVGA